MKTTLLYLRVFAPSDSLAPQASYYKPFEDRFHETYLRHKPGVPHELIVANCGISSGADAQFDDIASHQVYYAGPAWDIGAYQNLAPKIESDLIVCMATPVYFWRDNWLEPLVEAVSKYGHGAFAPMCSYENSPHLRTGCFAFHPKLMRDYPHVIDTRAKCSDFESHPGNFSQWAISKGYPVLMITADEQLELPDWRKPANIFRRGDQSNCLTWDRHNDIYRDATVEGKAALEKSANGQ